MNEFDIVKLIVVTFKGEFLVAICYFFLDTICRLAFSICIFSLLESVSEKKLQSAYIYSGVTIILWYLSQLFRISGYLCSGILSLHIKTGLTMLIYAKVISMISFSRSSS